jgi:glycosyltransferase involved in cell wall biosynthesis
MDIAIIHHQYQRKGGMERYLFDLLEGFAVQNDRTTVYVYKQDVTQPLIDNCNVVKHSLNWLPRVLRKYYFAHRLSRLHQRNAVDCTISLMRSTSQELVVSGGTHRGFLAHTNKKPSFWDRCEIKAEHNSFVSSKGVIAHSQMIADEIQRYYGIAPEKIHCLLPPINTQRFHAGIRQSRAEFRRKLNIEADKITLLFPSTGHKRKGLEPLLKALEQLPADRYELLIAGDKLPQNKIPNNVRCLGFVSDMAELYAAVDFTIMPSFYEPFGLVVPESLACGTPVIVSTFVGAKDLLCDNYGIVMPSVSVSDIKKAIEHASQRRFAIPEDFADRHNLSIGAHIAHLKSLISIL